MQVKDIQDGYLIRLEKGEKLIEALTLVLKEKEISSAHFQAIGGVSQAEIGFYSLEKREYQFNEFQKTLEIVSLLGNVSTTNGVLKIHAHIVLADQEMNAFGGHLKEATVGGTCEIYLVRHNIAILRKLDVETGLTLWDLDGDE